MVNFTSNIDSNQAILWIAYSAISEPERNIIKTELLKCFDEPVDAVAFQLAVIVAKISR